MKGKDSPAKAANQLPSLDKYITDTKNSLKQNNDKYVFSLQWVKELETLCIRYSYLCITPDLEHISLSEAWGLYYWLKRIED